MHNCCNAALTPQERWLEENPVPPKERERTFRMCRKIRNAAVHMDINRGRLFTESFKETEGQNLSLRWAKAMLHVAQNIPVVIGEDELLIGKMTGKEGRRCILYPELEGPSLPVLNRAHLRDASPFTVTPEDYDIIMTEIYPYWKDKSYAQAYATALPEETRQFIFGDAPHNYTQPQGVLNPTTAGRSSLNFSYDYPFIFANGMEFFRLEAEENLKKCQEEPATFIKEGVFWESSSIINQAFRIFVVRYAQEAQRLASIETNLLRQKELETISENCFLISTKPAETFWQALQLQWFIIVFARLEQNGGASLGNGRMDINLLPYYQNDIQNGCLTKEQAKELLECYWINLSQFPNVKLSESAGKTYEAYAHFESVTIGGLDINGKDATNELSYLILDSKRGFPSGYPDLAARVHVASPTKFLQACAEVIKEGQGFPKLFNDEEIIPLYIGKGATREQALNYSCSGCTEVRVIGESYVNGCCTINLGALIDMTMNDGRMRVLGNKQVGLHTGNPTNFKTYEEFFTAFKIQNENALKHSLMQQMIADQIKPTKLAAPFCSMLTSVCRDAKIDIHQYVPNSIRESFQDQIGFATMVDSVAAIKKLVFDDNTLSMQELCQALEANFEGYEPLRQRLLHAPKYGNNDSYADQIGRDLDQITVSYLAKHRGLHDEIISSRMVPITGHLLFGSVISATPDGRKAREYLSEGSSPSHGVELAGPTAIMISNKNVKNEGARERAARLLNIKLNPAVVAGEAGTKHLVDFIRTWCDLRLWHIQFNIINKSTLFAAQKDPYKYKDLVVRVAGYSAYFTDLTTRLQNEIIDRAEHSL